MRFGSVAAAVSLLAIGAAGSAVAAPAHKGHAGSHPAAPQIYYDISEEPSSLELLALGDSTKAGSTATMDVKTVTRSPNMLLGNTWKIDCSAERMQIIQTTRVQPGSPMQQADTQSEVISTRSSPKSFRIAQLACTGKGDLVERRTYHGELTNIVKRFWAAGGASALAPANALQPGSPAAAAAVSKPTMGACRMSTCAWSKTLARSVTPMPSGSLHVISILGGSTRSGDNNPAHIKWNPQSHEVRVRCSLTQPSVTAFGETTDLALNEAGSSISNVEISAFSIYAAECHSEAKNLDPDALARRFHYRAAAAN